MHMKLDARKTVKLTLGQYLESVRKSRGRTLRQVEEETGKQVSNAYLSQIENDKIEKPSLNVLNTLANFYGIELEVLMEMAGYITAVRDATKRHGRIATFAEEPLTPQEEEELLGYLKFIRETRKRRDKT